MARRCSASSSPAKSEPQTIGIPFSLISEAKLVAGEDAVRADLTAKKAH